MSFFDCQLRWGTKMRASSIAFATVLLVAGCGDDTTSGMSGDMSIAHDLSTSGNAPTCAAYCSKIAMNCTGSDGGGGNVQYPDDATCLSTCMTAAMWPAGMVGDTSGNTVGCRLYHAGAAAADPVLHCPHAGPTGGDVCGSFCDNYCQLMAKNCTGTNAVYDAPTCMSKCMSIPTNGHANDTSGNTIQCRIYHLDAAAADPMLHCPHSQTAADLPGGPCT
jgi:hypothetical protein